MDNQKVKELQDVIQNIKDDSKHAQCIDCGAVQLASNVTCHYPRGQFHACSGKLKPYTFTNTKSL